MINCYKELPQNTEHNCDSIRTNGAVFIKFQWQRQLEAVYDIRRATCISDAVFKREVQQWGVSGHLSLDGGL